MTQKSGKGLGRGLSALMADIEASTPKTPKKTGGKNSPVTDAVKNQTTLIPIEKIKPNPSQPRRDFPKEALAELAVSVTTHGIIQPIIVRPASKNTYQIIAGERRWRAAQRAKLHEIPVIIRDYTDDERLQVSIIENIQRADLNPLEEATAYQSLMDKFGHTQEKLSVALGKSRPYIANSLRLLSLPKQVLDFVRTGQLSAGHARLLIKHDDAVALAKQIVRDELSVRQVESLVKSGRMDKGASGGQAKPKQSLTSPKKAKDTIDLEQQIAASLGFRTQIQHKASGQSGQVVILYRSLEELDDLFEKLTQP